MTVSVVVPFRGDDAERSRNWAWNCQRWTAMDVVDEIVVEGSDSSGRWFGHAAAMNRGVARTTGDVLVLADADVAISPDWVQVAAEAVYSGVAPWVLASSYAQLTEQATIELTARSPTVKIRASMDDVFWRGDAVSWAPPVVLTRRAFASVGGYDERFGGWGGDDVALAAALDAIVGPHRRLPGEAVHLWHPREGLDAQPREQHNLMHLYIRARDDRGAMLQLIGERP